MELRRATLLSEAVTEAVILAVAAHWRADYEWYAHATTAVEDGSLDQRDLTRIASGRRGDRRYHRPMSAVQLLAGPR